MSLFDAVRSILGIKPVKVGDIADSVSPPSPVRRPSSPQLQTDSIADIDVIPEYKQVRALLDAKAPLLFVTGGAGTGKSTLISYLRHSLNARIAVVAPTGVAALNAGGVTIHSIMGVRSQYSTYLKSLSIFFLSSSLGLYIQAPSQL